MPEFDITRTVLEENNLLKICDYGERIQRCKIETISFLPNKDSKRKAKPLRLKVI